MTPESARKLLREIAPRTRSGRLAAAVVCGLLLILVASGNSRAAGFDLLAALATIGIARMLVSRQDGAFGKQLANASLAVHYLVVGAIQLYLAARGHKPLLTSDEFGYDRFAGEQSRAWLGTGPAVPFADTYLSGPFPYLLAWVYTIGGSTPLVGLTLPVAFGTWIPVLVHRLMTDGFAGFTARVSRTAGVLALVFPTTLVWSCLLLKDSGITAGTVGAMIGVCAFSSGRDAIRMRRSDLLIGIAGVAWLAGNRAIQLIPIAVGCLLFLMWLRHTSRLWIRALPLLAVVVAGGAALSVPSVRSRVDRLPKTLAIHRGLERLHARTAEAPEGPPHQATWLSTAAHIPSGVALVLLRPLPTEVEDLAQLVGAAGNLLYLLLIAVASVGLVTVWRTGKQRELLLLAGTVIMLWLVLAVSEGNAGTAWRHRDAVTPLLACLSAAALTRPAVWRRVSDLRELPSRVRPVPRPSHGRG